MSRIEFTLGTSYHPGWTIRDQTGAPVSLSGVEINFTVYTTQVMAIDAPSWLTKTVGAGIVLLDAANGVIRVDFSQYDTDFAPGGVQNAVYPWEMRMIDTSGEDRLIDKGFLILLPGRLDLGTVTPPLPP